MAKKKGSQVGIFNGFIKQMPRAMFYLISGEEIVKIEAEDDISVNDLNGNILIIEQLKHTTKNILTNKSIDFWGTLYNWTYNYINDEKKEKYKNTKYVLYLSNKEALPTKEISNLLNNIQNDKFDEIFENYVKLVTSKCKNELKNCLNYLLENKEDFYNILCRTNIQKPIINISQDLDNLIIKKYNDVYTEAFDDFTLMLDGWYTRKITKREDNSLKKCEITSTELEQFKTRFAGFETKVRFIQNTLTDDEIKKFENEFFVEQLNAISMDESSILSAKNAFKDWVNFQDEDLLDGKVTQEDLGQTYKNLKDGWLQVKSSVPKTIYPTELDQGKQIYKETLSNPVYIEGIEILGNSQVISRGAHNYLANHMLKHEHSIYWHPKFDKMRETDYE